MKKSLLLLFSLAPALFINAQSLLNVNATANSAKVSRIPEHRTCGVLDHEQFLQNNNPNRLSEVQGFEQQVQNWIATHQNTNTPQAAINIPVVVHVVYNGATQNIPTNQVLSQIQVLNEDFTHSNPDIGSVPAAWTSIAANVDINFCLAQQDPSGNATTGIDRVSTTDASFSTDDQVKFTAQGGANAWDPTRYFNIWVCNLGGGLLGYAEFPTASVSQSYGLVVGYFCFGSNYTSYGTFSALASPYDRGRTATHEIGHCFNLYHIWGDDGTACTGSDQVSDTPNQSSENYGCPAFPHTDACSPSSPGVMFMNYMDYTDDACMYMFTNGQKARIQAVVSTAPYNALTTSNACQSPASSPPVALFAASSVTVCPGTPITFTDQSTINATGWSWTFPGGSPASSTAQNPSAVTWSTPGTYTVTLIASNVNGSSTYTMAITILGSVNPPLTEGFENATYPPTNWTLYDAGNNGAVWTRANVGRNSSWSSKFDNYNINVAGLRDDIRTPKMNFSTAATCTLTFDVAHRRYSTTINDTLEVLVSTDCGATWTQVYIKGGTTLASVTGTQTSAFTPTNSQWRNETVNLNTYAGQSGVMIAFRNRGHYGNNIYVDNVNITTTVSALPNGAFTASATTVCRGTALSFTDNSTNNPTSWTWTFPGGTPASATTQNVASVVWNTAGTYTVTHTATNASGTGTQTMVITVNATPTVTTTTSGGTICSGNSTTITASGATTYAWMPGSLSGSPVTVSPATTTTYTVTGTGANGCTSTATRTITVNTSPTVTASSGTTTICSGNSTTLTATGASTYNWMPGSLSGSPVTVTPGSTTTYTVTGTAANGCTGTNTRTITVNPTPTVTTSASSTTICSGSSTTITASGATTYSWMPGSLSGSPVTVSPTTTTTYTVTGTSTGCSSTATRVITVNTTPTVTASSGTTTVCSGNSTTLSASGASTYSWMPGSLTGSPVTVTPGSTTTYTVTGTAANGCTATATRTITVNSSPTVTVSASSTSICIGNSVSLTGSGASSYSWNPGSLSGSAVTVTPASSTTYTATGTAANGCTGTSTVAITVGSQPTVTVTASSTSICSGSSATLNATGTSTFNWMPGSLSGSAVTVSPSATTTYTVTGTNGPGCSNTATITVTVNPNPTVSASAASSTICEGNSTTLTGTGAASFSWLPGPLSGNTVTVTPVATTTYSVTGTDANGCTNTATVAVVVNTTPSVTAGSSSSAVCVGDAVTLNGSGASTYNWMPGSLSGASVTDNPASSTTYTVTGTDANGCSNSATVAVVVNALPNVTITLSADTFCAFDGPTTLAGGSPAGGTYSGPGVSGGAFDASSVGTGSYPITYSYTDTTTGCTNSAAQSVVVDICNGTATTDPVNGTSLQVSPNPNNGQFNLSFDVQKKDNYILEIHNELGQIVYREDLLDFSGHYSNEISLKEYGRGAYTIRLRSEDKEIIERVITF